MTNYLDAAVRIAADLRSVTGSDPVFSDGVSPVAQHQEVEYLRTAMGDAAARLERAIEEIAMAWARNRAGRCPHGRISPEHCATCTGNEDHYP